MRTTNKLNGKSIENAKPKESPYKLSDGEGLYLLCTETGGKLWRLNYRFAGRQKTLAIGKYPTISLKKAREERAEAKRLLSLGIDPATKRQQEKSERKKQREAAQHTFSQIAMDWLNIKHANSAERYKKDVYLKIQKNLVPFIGDMQIHEIEPIHIMDCLRIIEERKAYDLAHRVSQISRQIFRYAWASGLVKTNPATDLVYALHARQATKHFPAILTKTGIQELLNRIKKIDNIIHKYLLKISLYVFVRPSEIRNAEWKEIDFSKAQWIIPAHKTKKRREHIVPLAPSTLELFKELKAICPSVIYCFPSNRLEKPVHETTTRSALRNLGYKKDEICLHGFRTTASTILNESGLFRKDVIERQLAHIEKNKSRQPYNRAEYIEERRDLMAWWANFLDELQN